LHLAEISLQLQLSDTPRTSTWWKDVAWKSRLRTQCTTDILLMTITLNLKSPRSKVIGRIFTRTAY